MKQQIISDVVQQMLPHLDNAQLKELQKVLEYALLGCEITKQEDWNDTYNEGFKKLKKLQPKGSSDYSQFQFDLVMANPPFAGDIKENTIISRYELGKDIEVLPYYDRSNGDFD